MPDQTSFAYILNRRPYRENSLLVDLFTESSGKITSIARPAKKRGKVTRGSLEPFRYLQVIWSGRGEVYTLKQVEERGRHPLSADQLLPALYINELILRLAYPQHPLSDLFLYYKNTLHALKKSNDWQVIMNFELYLLYSLGHGLSFTHSSDTGEAINSQADYRFLPEIGLLEDDVAQQVRGVRISGSLLLALHQTLKEFDERQLKELRRVLDGVFQILLGGKALNTRKVLGGRNELRY